MTAKIITVANQKGGTGKTTTLLSVSGQLAATNHKVLVVDLDLGDPSAGGSGACAFLVDAAGSVADALGCKEGLEDMGPQVLWNPAPGVSDG